MAPRVCLVAALCALVGGQSCYAFPSSHNSIDIQDGRIIGGDETTIDKFPYQIALFYFQKFRCGGSVLSEKWILTAAHCLYDVRMDWEVEVRAGSTQYASGGQLKKAKLSVYDTRFSMDTLQYDVGLVMLEEALAFGPNVKPVQLVDVGAEPKSGQTITLSGWGVTTEGGIPADNLRTVKVKAVRRWLCAVPYLLTARITNTMICASAWGKDSCQGDSGGPAVNSEGKQVGIVSFGNGCANALFPGVYTNLANAEVRNFIDTSIVAWSGPIN